MVYLLRYPINMTNIPKKMSDHGKQTKKDVFMDWYTAGMCQKFWYVGCYMTFLLYKRYVKVTKMTKVKNSGIQTGVCGNLVYECYMNKKAF